MSTMTNNDKLTNNSNFGYQNKNNVVGYHVSNEYWVSWIAFIIMSEHLKYCTHTYIIGHYNPSVKIIDLISHTICVVCVNFIHIRRDLQFKVDTERQIFCETFHGSFNLLSEFLPEICWEEIAKKILFVFYFDVCLGSPTLAPTHYLLNYGDFK